MKAHYGQPSGTYNLKLTLDELRRLESAGYLSIHTPEIPCETSRIVWNPENKDMDVVEKREMSTSGLSLIEFIGDEDKWQEQHYIQFLNIHVIKDEKRERCPVCQITGMDEPKFKLTHDGEEYEGRAHFCPKCGRYMGGLPRYSGNC